MKLKNMIKKLLTINIIYLSLSPKSTIATLLTISRCTFKAYAAPIETLFNKQNP